MAERRMFSKRVVRSARFLKMPVSSRDLYFQLGLEADDDGIVEAFNVMRLIGASEDDLRVLITKNFVQVLNEDLVAYITDWNENNKLRADRKVDSIYKDLLLQLNPQAKIIEPKPRADTKKLTGQVVDAQWTSIGQPMDRIGKDSIGKVSEGKESLVKESKEKIYFDNENINSIFEEFLQVRKKLKAVNSDRAIKTLINKLNKYSDDIKYQMIEKSIVNSWKDVYELKEEKGYQGNKGYTRQEVVPSWLNKETTDEPITAEEQNELEDLLSEFKEPFEERKAKLEAKLKEKYGKKGNDD